MNDLILQSKISSLEEAIKKATEAASKLLRCAESISNPQYVVTMEGQQLEILAAAHTAGVITLRVKSPFATTAYEANQKALAEQVRRFREEGKALTAEQARRLGFDV
jgi:hypothetical protein